jgi:hypothetical protein
MLAILALQSIRHLNIGTHCKDEMLPGSLNRLRIPKSDLTQQIFPFPKYLDEQTRGITEVNGYFLL